MEIDILTPSENLYSGTIRSAKIPVRDGLISVLPSHAPLVALLGQGLLSLDSKKNGNDDAHAFIIDGGFMEIGSDKITILADHGETVEAIQNMDKKELQMEYEIIKKENVSGDEEIANRLRRLAVVRTRLQAKG